MKQVNRTKFVNPPKILLLAIILSVLTLLYLYTDSKTHAQTGSSSALDAPTLTVEAGESEGEVELSWTAVTGAARYELWTWTSAGGHLQLDDGSLTDTTFSHTDLIVGTTYHYWVRAVNGSGETSAWSESKQFPVSDAAQTPTATLSVPVLTVVIGDDEVELSWTAVTDAVRYDLWTWTSADGHEKLDDGSLTDTTFGHTDLVVGTTYHYWVRAVNEKGQNSDWSESKKATWGAATSTATATPTATTQNQQRNAPATATPTATPTPSGDATSENIPATGAPTISGTARVCQTLTANFSRIEDENGLDNVSYSVTWYAGGGYFRKTSASDYTYIVQSRDVGLTIDVSVHFDDDDGNSESLESAQTAAVVAATTPGKPQRAPGQIRAQAQGSGKLSVSWIGPSPINCHDGGSPITGFKVQWKKASDSWSTPSDVSEATVSGSANESYTISSLINGEEYTVRVFATNSVGDSAASTVVTATPQDSTTQ